MPEWLAEPASSLLLALAALAVCAVAVWVRTRRRVWLSVAAGAAVLIAVLWICDRLYESDREQIARSVTEMAAAVKPKQFDVVFAHVADSFRLGTLDKAVFRKFCEDRSHNIHVEELKVWDIQLMALDKVAGTAEVAFFFKLNATGVRESPLRCKAKYIRNSSGRWQMQGFTVYPPHGFDAPITVPGLG